MAYYCFDRCSEDDLSDIEKIASDLELEQYKTNPPDKSWLGAPSVEGFEGFLLVSYQPNHKHSPFLLQTSRDVDHKNEKVLGVIKRFISVCKPNTIYDQELQLYDMAEFE